jgi:hypothetical protein
VVASQGCPAGLTRATHETRTGASFPRSLARWIGPGGAPGLHGNSSAMPRGHNEAYTETAGLGHWLQHGGLGAGRSGERNRTIVLGAGGSIEATSGPCRRSPSSNRGLVSQARNPVDRLATAERAHPAWEDTAPRRSVRLIPACVIWAVLPIGGVASRAVRFPASDKSDEDDFPADCVML